MNRALVFGASGYIGSHVLEQLLLAGHRVTAVIRSSSNRSFIDTTAAQVQVVDFADDQALVDVIRGHDVVYSCLADPKIHNAEHKMREVEITLTRRVLRAAAQAGVQRFVQLSSIQVYGFDRPDHAINEQHGLQPTYAFNRVCVEREQVVLSDASQLGLPIAILRPVTVLGARDPQFAAIVKAHRQGAFLMVNGGADFSAIDARDAGRAMMLLGACELAEYPVYLAKGFDTSWLAVKQQLDQQRGRMAKLIRLPKILARLIGWMGDLMPYSKNPPLTSFSVAVLSTCSLFDDRKIRVAGFVPQHTLAESLAVYSR